jgi:hypothetical protein
MSPDVARRVIAMSATMAPHPKDRAIGMVILLAEQLQQRRPAWWQWTTWLSAGITCTRIEAA